MYYYISIPDCFVWMTVDCENRGGLFKKYVQGFITNSYPDMTLVKIKGMTAICEKKGDNKL